MSSKIRKIISVLIILVVLAGWYIGIFGIGKIPSMKNAMKFGLDINGGVYVVMEADTDLKGDELKQAMDQTRAVLNKRVNAMGISEATVSLEGERRIRVEMPGVENAEEAIKEIGRTAQLRFLLADGTPILTGEDVKDAGYSADSERGGFKVELKFSPEGTEKFTAATEKASQKQVKSTNEGVADNAIMIMLDTELVSAPVAEQTINTSTCEITSHGGFSQEEASNLSALIRGGALPVTLREVTSSVQTATIGEDALHKSIIAGIIGMGIVFLLMVLVYRLLGLVADIALLLYVLLVLWTMSAIGTVLTLPGIAAIILSIGMAVDANVIIFSRIREEIANGKGPRVAVSAGFGHAVVTVLDAQITTLIAAIVLYQIGSTTVKGFAITLIIGIVASIFTAVVISQILIGLLAESRRFSSNRSFGCDESGKPFSILKKDFNFIGHRKKFYLASLTLIVAGLLMGAFRSFNYGIDFTGGTMLQIDMGKTVSTEDVETSIKKYELNPSIILAGENKDRVIIKTIKALDNDQRQDIVQTIASDLDVSDPKILSSEQFGPTVGKELEQNAVKSIIIASLCMLIYIILRFKSWKYGVSAVAGLVHDVLAVVALYGIFRFTINNPFIAGILTVVGYSINDTIVIFDRIRENRVLYKKSLTLLEIINKSINQTIGRSLMTSLTTLACIIPLTIMVSASIRGFVIPLMLGVMLGTYSSIFLCSPLFYEFSKKEGKSAYVLQREKREAGKK